jgi:hypothetical protein
MVEYLKLLTTEDYRKLTNDDLKELRKLIPELKETICDPKEWLKNNIGVIEDSSAIEIIKDKVFAGQITIKLYKVNTIISREDIIKKLKSKEFKYNKIEKSNEEKISIYSTFYIEENKYLIRLRYDNGERTAYGHKFEDIRYIDVLYHVDEKVLEVRSDINKAKKIINFLNKKLNIGTIEGIRVLRKHKNIENFAAGINGHFKKMNSNTALEANELNSKDIIALGELVLAIDDFLLNDDITTFIEKLEVLKFSNKLTFTQAFLAGCNQIGISVSNNQNGDLRNQGLYKVLSKYLSNENGYISFASSKDSNEVTIRLSTKLDTNTIQFVSSATEKEIDIIIRNIVEDIRSKIIDISEVNELSNEIQKYIENPEIRAIRPEYLVENFNLEEDTVIGILEGYIKNGYLSEEFELINPNNCEVLKEFSSLNEIREDIDFIIDKVDSDYKLIDNNKSFVEEYEEFINIKYVIVNHEIKKSQIKFAETIAKQLELQLNNNSNKNLEEKKSKKKIFNGMKAKLIASIF